MAFPNITLDRGTTLNPIALVLWDDEARTIRTDISGSSPVALVKNKSGEVIIDLEPTIEPATNFPELGLTGDVIVLSLTAEQTAAASIGRFSWDLINEYATTEKQLISEGEFQITESVTLG
jgi:hypothetical protein